MESKEVEAVCIGARRYRENDKMLTLFCESGETVTAVCRGALKNTSKLKFASQLFSVCAYSLSPSKAGYYIVSGAAQPALSFLSLAEDPKGFAFGCVCCEIVRLAAPVETPPMYGALIAALGELASGEAVKHDLVCVRLMLAALLCNGYASVGGSTGALCRAVEEMPVGNASGANLTGEERNTLFRSVTTRFSSVFGRLQSLQTALLLQEAEG